MKSIRYYWRVYNVVDVSRIFVNYKTKDLTINAIKSVFEKTNGIHYEIFVVDNNSNDGSIEAIEKQFPQVNIIKNTINAGFGTANNLAIKQAKGKYILCLNTDTILLNNAIKIMFDFMEKEENQEVGVCGGYLVNKDDEPCYCCGHFPTLTSMLWEYLNIKKFFPDFYKRICPTLNLDEIIPNKDIDYISGADICFRKSVLDKVGLFDEKFFMYYEETDLCKRIKNSGYGIKIIESAQIKHLEGMSLGLSLDKRKLIKQSCIYYFRKHHPFQIGLIKLMFIVIYITQWLILGKKDSKEMLFVTINEKK